MSCRLKNHGFSLTEVLIAVGILAVGMTFIAGVFPVAVHFSTLANEQTLAAVIADEAFAKVRIYGVDPAALPADRQTSFEDAWVVPPADAYLECAYPSTDPAAQNGPQNRTRCGCTPCGPFWSPWR